MASATRLFVDAPLTAGARLSLPEDAFRHLVQVLRARSGDRVLLFNGRGGQYEARLDQVGKREASVLIERHLEGDGCESALQLTLAQAVSKGDRMDYTLQKAVELGVSQIQPLITERSVVRLDAGRWDRKLEHWRGVTLAACEQSGRTRPPRLLPVLRLAAWLEQPRPAQLCLALAPSASQSLRALPRSASVGLLVGPEGGLSDAEIALAQQQGFSGIAFGPRILRTETAGVAALAAIQALWGDLG